MDLKEHVDMHVMIGVFHMKQQDLDYELIGFF
jgi:hypothetical protein